MPFGPFAEAVAEEARSRALEGVDIGAILATG